MKYYIIFLLLLLISGCNTTPAVPPTSTPVPLADEITIYHFDGGLSQSIIDAFTEEYGVKVNFATFETYEEATESVIAGGIYDVVWLDTPQTGRLLQAGLLSEIDYQNIPNARNIAANFRDLAFDPNNEHIIPWTWGTTGMAVRTDLADLTTWAALWDQPEGTVGLWEDPRNIIGFTLGTLGYSANTTNPEELEAAYDRLVELKDQVIMLGETDPYTSAYDLAEGKVNVALGWAYDVRAALELNVPVAYVIPEEGAHLWLETMVIPTTAKEKYTAEVFINYMLRPETAAQFTNDYFYATTIDGAREFVDEAIVNDAAVYPTDAMLTNAELLLPLSPENEALYNDVWQRFMALLSEPAPDATAEATIEATSEVTVEPTTEATTEATIEATTEVTVEATPETTAEATSEATPEATAKR